MFKYCSNVLVGAQYIFYVFCDLIRYVTNGADSKSNKVKVFRTANTCRALLYTVEE